MVHVEERRGVRVLVFRWRLLVCGGLVYLVVLCGFVSFFFSFWRFLVVVDYFCELGLLL